jgi:hypothetical protein
MGGDLKQFTEVPISQDQSMKAPDNYHVSSLAEMKEQAKAEKEKQEGAEGVKGGGELGINELIVPCLKPAKESLLDLGMVPCELIPKNNRLYF